MKGALLWALGTLSLWVAAGAAEAGQLRRDFATLQARTSCASLAGRAITAAEIGIPAGAATVTAATLVSATGPVTAKIFDREMTTPAVPEYCRATGVIRPLDQRAPDINFQVNLPSRWNQRVVQLGGSGLDGAIPASLNNHFNAPEMQPAGAAAPVARGFMEIGSDSGHAGQDVAWISNAEAVANLAHLQLKKTRDVAVSLAKSYYGSPPQLVYFLGSSQGGREALMAVQKYPADYAGVFSQVPILSFNSLTLNPTLRAGMQTGPGWIPPAKVSLIGREVIRQCDALDGLSDGVVSDYSTCNARFVDLPPSANPWAAIRCPTGGDEGDACLSDAQLATLRAIHSLTTYGFPLAYGAPGFAGWGVGGETPPWLTEPARPDLATYGGGIGALWWKGVIVGDPQFSALGFVAAAYKEKLLAASAQSDATDPDLTAFKARGGKLLLKGNTGDYVANYRELIRYYEQVVGRMGQAGVDSFVRFYVAPGQGHSMFFNQPQQSVTGVEIPAQADMLQLLDDWVMGKALPPDALMLTSRQPTPPYTVTASRPICRFPAYPHFRGGDPSVGSNFRCTRPKGR